MAETFSGALSELRGLDIHGVCQSVSEHKQREMCSDVFCLPSALITAETATSPLTLNSTLLCVCVSDCVSFKPIMRVSTQIQPVVYIFYIALIKLSNFNNLNHKFSHLSFLNAEKVLLIFYY